MKPRFVVFNGAGDTVYYSQYHVCRGYGTPERPHAAVNIPDGVIALDTRHVGREGAIHLTFSGPLLNVDMTEPATSMGPYDFVGVSDYVENWKKVGARVGHYKDGKPVWED